MVHTHGPEATMVPNAACAGDSEGRFVDGQVTSGSCLALPVPGSVTLLTSAYYERYTEWGC